MGRAQIANAIRAAVVVTLLAPGCAMQPGPNASSLDNNDGATLSTSVQAAECGNCNYWFCYVYYTPCIDGACQGSGAGCTPDTEQSDCAFLACEIVENCCPEQ